MVTVFVRSLEQRKITKELFEGDKGKNTGGMGAYSPSSLESEELNKKIIDKIIGTNT